MAQLIKRGSTWYTRFQHKGRDYWRSTGETSKARAKTVAPGIIAEVKGEVSLSTHFDKVLAGIEDLPESIRDQTRRDYARRLLRDTQGRLAIADAWGAWMSSPRKGRRANPKESTIAGYRAIWIRFAGDPDNPETRPGWLPLHHPEVDFLHEVTDAMADAYATDLHASNMSPATYNAHIKFLRSMFETLSIRAGLLANPWKLITSIELETISKRELTTEEMAAVCGKATGELRYWIAIGVYTGLRLGDVVTLRWSEVDLEAGMVERVPLKVDRKGAAKTVRCPIHPVLSAMLSELREASSLKAEYLFPKAAKEYGHDRTIISKRVQAYLSDTCGIRTNEAAGNGRQRAVVRVGFHSLRHSFVSLCAANRVPQPAIMELVGHRSPAMTQLYMHADQGQKQQAIAALPDRLFADEGGQQ